MTAPVIISPTLDEATVDATLGLVNGLRADGFPPVYVAEIATQFLTEQVAKYRREAVAS